MLSKLKERRQRIKQEKTESRRKKDVEDRKILHLELERLKREEETADLRLTVKHTKERISKKRQETNPLHKLASKLKEATAEKPKTKPKKSSKKNKKKKTRKNKSKDKSEPRKKEKEFWEF